MTTERCFKESKEYPTIQEVESASREQLAKWYRFLDSPGASAIGREDTDFETQMKKEAVIMDRIMERFKEEGGFTPDLSKLIGWG